jgi:hypothetical protein
LAEARRAVLAALDMPYARVTADNLAKLLRSADSDELALLESDADPTIALHAALYRMCGSERTGHFISETAIDPTLAEDFLRYFSRRTGTLIPGWWAGVFADIGRGETGFPPAANPVGAALATLPGETAEDAGEFLRFQSGETRIVIPKRRLNMENATDNIRVAIKGSLCCVLTYSSGSGVEMALDAFDPGTQRRRWNAEVWGEYCGGGTGMIKNATVSILPGRDGADEVAVFGVGPHGRFAEVFDARTGRPKYRFSTSYWGGVDTEAEKPHRQKAAARSGR